MDLTGLTGRHGLRFLTNQKAASLIHSLMLSHLIGPLKFGTIIGGTLSLSPTAVLSGGHVTVTVDQSKGCMLS